MDDHRERIARIAAELLDEAGGDPIRAVGLAWFRYFGPPPPIEASPPIQPATR